MVLSLYFMTWTIFLRIWSNPLRIFLMRKMPLETCWLHKEWTDGSHTWAKNFYFFFPLFCLHWCESVHQAGSSEMSWSLWGLLFPETIFTQELSWKSFNLSVELSFLPLTFFSYHLIKPSYKEEGNWFFSHNTDQISKLIDCGDNISIEQIKMGCSFTFKYQALLHEPESTSFQGVFNWRWNEMLKYPDCSFSSKVIL